MYTHTHTYYFLIFFKNKTYKRTTYRHALVAWISLGPWSTGSPRPSWISFVTFQSIKPREPWRPHWSRRPWQRHRSHILRLEGDYIYKCHWAVVIITTTHCPQLYTTPYLLPPNWPQLYTTTLYQAEKSRLVLEGRIRSAQQAENVDINTTIPVSKCPVRLCSRAAVLQCHRLVRMERHVRVSSGLKPPQVASVLQSFSINIMSSLSSPSLLVIYFKFFDRKDTRKALKAKILGAQCLKPNFKPQ